jgi:hypothetical protein
MTRRALHGLGGSALLFFLWNAAAACGPSFQAVYEGERNFEHCYALDQTQASVEAKKDCWREWLRGYTYGQSNDRVEYAATRFSQLSLDPTLPSEDVADGGGASRRPHKTDSVALAAPAPTSAFAPPPNMSAVDGHDPPPPVTTGGDGGKGAHGAKDGMKPGGAPGAECLSACEARWSGCANGCKDATCEACDKGYRSCVTTCVREGHESDGGAPSKGKP